MSSRPVTCAIREPGDIMIILTREQYDSIVEHAKKHVPLEACGLIGGRTEGETRTVDVHVQRLRKKLGSETIATVYRFGYKLQATPA